jgi:hypothetical protein
MNKKRKLWALGLVVLVGALALAIGASVYIGPRNVIGMLRYDTRRQGALRVGDLAPDVELVTPVAPGGDVANAPRDRLLAHLNAHLHRRPLVLVFGSFT